MAAKNKGAVCRLITSASALALCCVATQEVAAREAPPAAAPMIRWWLPNAAVDLQEINRELQEVAEAGFAGVEVVSLPHKLAIDPTTGGWGSQAWNDAMRAMLTQARTLGLQVDMTIGPAWPSLVPGLSPDALEAEKVLAMGTARLAAGEQLGMAPAADTAPRAGVNLQTLSALVAYPVSGEDGGTPLIDLANGVDITDQFASGTGDWTAPVGDWLVVSAWMRGTGQKDNMRPIEGPNAPDLVAPTGYAVDHFSVEGARVVTDYWDRELLADGIGELMRENGSGIFEDSLELYGSPLWTPSFFAEFEARHGYSLRPWIAALFLSERMVLGEPNFEGPPAEGDAPSEGVPMPDADAPPPGPPAAVPGPFATDPELRDRVLEDYEDTLTALYIANRVTTITHWAQARGLHFRNQPYGPPVDSGLAAAFTGVPEGESLGFGQSVDAFRVLAAGRDMAGTNILSDECCADFDAGYAMTWDRMLDTIHRNFAAGVNQIVVHGLAYDDANLPADWPGWAPMVPFGPLGTGFAEAWGPRNPTWAHMRPIVRYLGRTQGLLRAGRPRVDVAIYRMAYQMHEEPLVDQGFADAGYSYGMLTPGLFDHPNAVVEGGVLAPDGAGYRVLVFAAPERVRLDAMEHILKFAQAGLPIVLVGPPPQGISGFAKEGEEERLAEILAALPQQDGVSNVQTFDLVPAKLREIGIAPSADLDDPAPFRSVHRQTDDADFYWLLNTGDRTEERTVTLTGSGAPVLLNMWSGKEQPVSAYSTDGNTFSFTLVLEPGETAAFALYGDAAAPPHVNSTTANSVQLFDGQLFAISDAAGTFEAQQGDQRLQATIASLPGTIDLTGSEWTLDYEDWRPGASAHETRKGRRTITLSGLRPWTEIEGLEDTAGVGAYAARFEVPAGAEGYVLDLGEVSDTVIVTVNGIEVAVDQVTHRVDLGGLVLPGANSIAVEVATPLLNRLRITQPNPFAKKDRLATGLIGPVRLIPYGMSELVPASPVRRDLERASALGFDVCPFVSEVDSDGDGQMSAAEWTAVVVGPPVDVFFGFDHDGDGLVSCDEMDQNGAPPGGFDSNGDGALSVSELNDIVARLAPMMEGQ